MRAKLVLVNLGFLKLAFRSFFVEYVQVKVFYSIQISHAFPRLRCDLFQMIVLQKKTDFLYFLRFTNDFQITWQVGVGVCVDKLLACRSIICWHLLKFC